jgi:hypothetical protein
MTTQILVELLLIHETLGLDRWLPRLPSVPDKTWCRGELIHPELKPRHKNSGAAYSSGWMELDEEAGVGIRDLAQALMHRLEPGSESLQRLVEDCRIEAELSIAVKMRGEDRPAMALSPMVVAWVAALGGGIDVDLT